MNDKINRLIGGKSKEDRRKAMFEQISAPNIRSTTPSYSVSAPMAETTQKKLLVVTLDKLRPYEGNPRRTKNPAYEEIKASIKARGLDHAPNITQRPGDEFYTIADGGNTRLQALKELFTETQDPKFWSIECVFKPWQGEADDINAKLNILIGHLAENDVRGDLSFIEKALGVKEVKALYEEKYHEFFSHRKLAEKLGENGYPISNQIIARMEQCLTYLYPHIPNVLFTGLGKPQIEKLLAIHRNAQGAWDKYKESITVSSDFSEVWVETLSPFDEDPTEFAIATFQDALIGALYEALLCQISYDTLKIEIDLEERKLQRLMEKQSELAQRATESEARVQQLTQEAQASAGAVTKPAKTQPAAPTSDHQTAPASHKSETETGNEGEADLPETTFGESETDSGLTLPDFDLQDDVTQAMTDHFAGLGMTIGVNPEAERAEQAVENGLEFANTGKQPIHNLWKIHPNRQHKMEAYSLALDIAEEVGIAHLVEHCVYDPVDYSFKVQPLATAADELTTFVHSLLTGLATDQIAETEHQTLLQLNTALLIGQLAGEPALSDLLLVRIFRLIRVVRYIKAQARLGGNNAQ